jgi:hypothetical protein
VNASVAVEPNTTAIRLPRKAAPPHSPDLVSGSAGVEPVGEPQRARHEPLIREKVRNIRRKLEQVTLLVNCEWIPSFQAVGNACQQSLKNWIRPYPRDTVDIRISMDRKRTAAEIETSVLFKSARRCTLCFYLSRDLNEKRGQLAHLDKDPSNDAEDNLAFMCLDHHTL